MVTVLPLIEQADAVVTEKVGVTPLFCVVISPEKLDKYGALVGAPVNVTVGAIRTGGPAFATTVSVTYVAAA